MYLTASTFLGLFLITITSLYLAAEPDFYLRGIRRVLPAAHRAKIEACLKFPPEKRSYRPKRVPWAWVAVA